MLNLMQAHSYPLLKWYKAGRPAGIYRQGIEKKRIIFRQFSKRSLCQDMENMMLRMIEENKTKGREKLSLVDWLRSKTPSVAVEVNSDEEATKLLQENKVFNLILTIVIQR